ncbi:AVN_HP_G0135080.mRNA.1.CDS.1 [Saccharomyces cerevisiae]|nr:AVN_HP_G0135080.mRNA.1.CDS.1 [Saccharomyces cerevisiae]CAI6432002.1 AVN_HP_G0135080.mRNA.1.CDS.1 [Saccharomyces cerevisiae]
MMYSKILGGGSYIDDGNGNIIPQLPDNTTVLTPNGDASNNNEILDSDTGSSNGTSGGGQLINVESLEEQLSLSTESDLHNKLREMLINRAQEDITLPLGNSIFFWPFFAKPFFTLFPFFDWLPSYFLLSVIISSFPALPTDLPNVMFQTEAGILQNKQFFTEGLSKVSGEISVSLPSGSTT